jgi:hypothetical protein
MGVTKWPTQACTIPLCGARVILTTTTLDVDGVTGMTRRHRLIHLKGDDRRRYRPHGI